MWYCKMYFPGRHEVIESDAFGTQGAPSQQKVFPFLESLLSFTEPVSYTHLTLPTKA